MDSAAPVAAIDRVANVLVDVRAIYRQAGEQLAAAEESRALAAPRVPVVSAERLDLSAQGC